VNEPVPDIVGDMVCSARRCTCEAQQALLWNNPRLHTPERRKVWLSCDEHLDHLSQFLQVRGFLQSVVGVAELAVPVPVGA
jgi:hypothetical protein